MSLRDFGGGFSDGVVVEGHVPVWTLGLGGTMVHLQPAGSDAPFPAVKVMWIVGPDETQPVVVRGKDASTGAPLWFDIYPPNTDPQVPPSYTTTLVLDPAHPNRGYAQNTMGNWSIWGIGVGALTEGCFQMAVTSSKGTARTVLAVGR